MRLNKIIIPTHGRAETISTIDHIPLDSYDVHLIVNPPEQLSAYHEALKGYNVTIHSASGRKIGANNYAIKKICEKDEWVLFLDDNIHGWYKTDQGKDRECSFEEWAYQMERDLEHCDKNHIRLWGQAIVDNLFFRKKWYTFNCFILGKAYAMKISDFLYDTNMVCKEDYDVSAWHIWNAGGNMRNNHLYSKHKFFDKGGFGKRDARNAQYIKDADYLMKKYPQLFRYKRADDKSEVVIRPLKQEKIWELKSLARL